ncbi:MAG: hypothetical protein GY869_20065 [Planctomycetes bacterium]|nr:hypothetical protein [Planctomycetota bacterium]
MSGNPIRTVPPSTVDKLLQEKYAESIAGQSDLMDKLGRQLITIELAIPGLYATALKIVGGKDETISVTLALGLTFGCWFGALLFTLLALYPRKWQVNRNIMKKDPKTSTEVLGIEDFFHQTAVYKRLMLIVASLLFFVGIICAVLAVL